MLDPLKQALIEEVDRLSPELLQISRFLHANPELSFEEHQAAELLIRTLEEHGFSLERGVARLTTAFTATYASGEGPTIAFLAEYDALPGMGHACGHNLIASASVGAALALKSRLAQIPGRVLLVGCPAEEKGGGKIPLVEAGLFQWVDAAMLVHPSNRTEMVKKALGMRDVQVEFFGKAAHAAALPYLGINALDAVILTFNNINALRQQLRSDTRVHGIITHGGKAPNIIPDYAAALFYVRALDMGYLEELYQKVLGCFEAAASATGTTYQVKRAGHDYHPHKINYSLAQLFRQNLEALGAEVDQGPEDVELGSTDVGNVSQVVPTLQPTITICGPKVSCHMPEFAVASGSSAGEEGMLLAARAMALTGLDLLRDRDALDRVKAEFAGGRRP
ncbi:MAG: M20 family metallopeptidase [Candidatus Methylomirabilales bacterium]|nr:M20 family metallopeptidase [candidate division NC10 bacterium]